jgi:predicted dienelactone hydrolase
VTHALLPREAAKNHHLLADIIIGKIMRGRRLLAILLAILCLLLLLRLTRRQVRLTGAAAERVHPSKSGSAPASIAECKTSVGYRVMRFGGRVTALWYPTDAQPTMVNYSPRFAGLLAKNAPAAPACGERAPLVVFSHGYTGCGLQSVSLTEELARHGYVVAAPDHADAAICHTLPLSRDAPKPVAAPQPSIFDPSAWDDSSRADRRQDVEAVIDGLLKNSEFEPILDPQKIGLAGHSLGGYIVVGMAGGWPSWSDSRIRAVLALSPYVMPFQLKNTLGNVRVPLMYQGGTLDVGITPFLKGPEGAYAVANSPVYFLELKSAAHLAWTNCGDEQTVESCLAKVANARLIAQYGIAFFDRHLKGLPEPVLTEKNSSLQAYEFRQ